MRVSTRITVATSTFVIVGVVLIGLWDLRRQNARDRDQRVGEARKIAFTLRAALELGDVRAALELGPDYGRELSLATGWEVTLIPVDSVIADERVARRVETLATIRPASLVSEAGGHLIYSIPIRIPNAKAPKGFDVAGVLEVDRHLGDLADARTQAWWRALAFLLIITAIVLVALLVFTRGLVTRPIAKLLAGIDDVARGDLTHAVLSEREDEIGQLANRFNEMTFSLRESRAETGRQNQARHALEDRLFQTEKMATIGQLAAEIAHEVGTPLNVISGRARTLGKKAKDTEAVVKNATIIAEQSQRITRIIQRLLDFARRRIGHVETELVDLGEIADTTIEFLEGRLRGANVTATQERDVELPLLRGQPDQIQQVLLNLIINAIEAMPGGGKLRISTTARTRRRPGLADAAPEKVVEVVVADTGPGIPPDARERIFEPFYTSKDREGGTGLGLAVSHGIVKEHDGWIDVQDGETGGTEFHIFFPIAAAASNPPERQAPV